LPLESCKQRPAIEFADAIVQSDARFFPIAPVRERKRQEMRDVDDFGRLTLDHGRADETRLFARKLNIEPVFDDVDNLVDDETH
jgi:hypothetical protein